MKKAEDLFRRGIKKSILLVDASPYFVEFVSKFPYTNLSYTNRSGIYVKLFLFFQTKKDKEKFDRKGICLKRKRKGFPPYKEKVMGSFLGYPKIAIKDYIKGMARKDSITVIYSGIRFNVKNKNLYKALKQMHNKMQLKDPEIIIMKIE